MAFQTVLILTDGGPGTDPITAFHLYQQAFRSFDFGVGLFDFRTQYGIDIPGLLAVVTLPMVPILLVHFVARRALVRASWALEESDHD